MAAIPRRNIVKTNSLTAAENLIWLGQRLSPNSPLYNMAHLFELPPDLDIETFAAAFKCVLRDCESLRTVVVERDGIPVREVRAEPEIYLESLDFSDKDDGQAAARGWVDRRVKQVLDLESRLYDAALLTTAPGRHSFYLNQHHIVTDVSSQAIILGHISRCYDELMSGSDDCQLTMPSYSEYVRSEHESKADPSFEDKRSFWNQKIGGASEPLRLYGVRSTDSHTDSVRVARDLGVNRSAALRSLASGEARMLTENLSMFSMFATILSAFLHRISGSSDIVIGTPVHNRTTPGFKATVGLLIELFPLYSKVESEESFESLLAKVQAEVLDVLRNAHPGTSSVSLHSQFNVVLNYVTAKFPKIDDQDIRSEWIHPDEIDAGHALRLHVRDVDQTGSFDLSFDFNTGVFSDKLRLLAVDQFFEVVDAFLEDRSTRVADVPLHLLEHKQARETGNQADGSLETVLSLFEQRVADSGELIAIDVGDQSVSYAELDHKANQVANLLLDHGLTADQPVAVQLPRSIDFVAALLGVMKAGGAFCPIPPGSPPEREQRILEDLGDPIILNKGDLKSLTDDSSGKPVAEEGSTAYILFTSGSTGRPKGVVVGQEAFSNYVSWASRTYVADSYAAWPFFTSTGFDLTLTSVFVPLVSGGKIVVYPESDGPSDASVLQVFTDDRVDVVKLTPSHLAAIRDVDLSCSKVRMLILGGERFPRGLALRALGDFGGPLTIYNEYGPTEATIGCVVHRFDPNSDISASVLIGRPIPGAEIRVLDNFMHDVPIGGVGELYVGGLCLAQGYRDEDEPSAERFSRHPDSGERLYATGDLVRIHPGWSLEYLGRTDDQVKILGHRIETLEVEAVLCKLPSVAAAAVVAIEPSQPDTTPATSRCVRCGLPSNVPGTRFDAEGVCNVCSEFTSYADHVADYWGNLHELESILKEAEQSPERSHDCILLFSGGKDSTYALARLVEMGLSVLAFTLDNGFISDQAKANIRRVTTELQVDLVFGETPAMNAIFVDSLNRHANVCNGCFKTIYTLGMKEALQRNIPFIVTGLSRGQLFETRLTGELFSDQSADADMIDLTVLEARKAYHRLDDGVNRLLKTDWINEDTFDRVRFVDFYRYCDAELEEVYSYLSGRVPWIRPGDTGRSTNCLINDLGIYVHTKTRGFHNYAYPYSWDVRLGHKQRDAALAELDDEIDESQIDRMMKDIGYAFEEGQATLTAYVVPETGNLPDLESALGEWLPPQMVPSRFIEVAHLPMNANGKIDRARLAQLSTAEASNVTDYIGPRNEFEQVLCQAWEAELGRRIGIHDNFFSAGGDSLKSILIASKMNRAGYRLKPTDFFRHPTIADLATHARTVQTGVGESKSERAPDSNFGLDNRRLSQLEAALARIDGDGKR